MARFLATIATGLAVAGCATIPVPSLVPFDPHSDQVAISSSINAIPLRFLVDTAVDPSAIDRPAALSAGLKQLGGEEEIGGVGSEAATAYPSVIPQLVIAGRSYGPIGVVVNDMSKIRARYGAPLDGVLGYSLLKDHAVLFDYPANRITLFDGAASREPRGCRAVHRFPLRFRSQDDPTILVPGLTIGGVEVPAFLDTGSSNGLRINLDSPSVAPILAMLPKGRASTSVGARGEAKVERARLDVPVALGPFRLASVDVSMAHEKDRAVEVNIGNRFLRAIGAKLLVDLPARKVGLFGACA